MARHDARAASYAGWLPALGMRETTVAGPAEKLPTPLVAHLVYGATPALAFELLRRRARQTGRRGEPARPARRPSPARLPSR